MPHAQAWMSALFDVTLRSPEAKNQEIAQTFFGPGKVSVFFIHGPENVIVRDAPVKRGYQPFEPVFADRGINLVFLH